MTLNFASTDFEKKKDKSTMIPYTDKNKSLKIVASIAAVSLISVVLLLLLHFIQVKNVRRYKSLFYRGTWKVSVMKSLTTFY